jgi:hypothetical protein
MARTPQQNGVSERRNKTIIESARSMAASSNCPSFLWTELVNTANYLTNLSPIHANNGITPDQKYTRCILRIDHLRIFGSLCFLHIPKESRSKLESKTKRCYFLGYDEQSKAYRIFDLAAKRIHISRDIVFDETKIGYEFA